jgi:hypothetical protein
MIDERKEALLMTELAKLAKSFGATLRIRAEVKKDVLPFLIEFPATFTDDEQFHREAEKLISKMGFVFTQLTIDKPKK